MSFDVHDIESYFLEQINRTESEDLLKDTTVGTFLVRMSSNENDLALSIKEPSRIGHYQIQRRFSNTRSELTIGNQSFPALPELLTFYKLHYVGDTPLIRPILSPISVPTINVTSYNENNEVSSFHYFIFDESSYK